MRCVALLLVSLVVSSVSAQTTPLVKMFLRVDTVVEEGETRIAHEDRHQQLTDILQLYLSAENVAFVAEEEAHWEMRVRAVPRPLVNADVLALSVVLAQPIADTELLREDGKEKSSQSIESGAWVEGYMRKQKLKRARVFHDQEVFVVAINDLQAAAIQITDYVDQYVLQSLRALRETMY